MSATRPDLRVAIIGTGGIAHAHAQALAELPDKADLVAVAEVDSGRGAAFAEQYAVPAVYDSVESLLEAEKIDLVHVCTPPMTHAPIAIAAMRAGVPALVEKPTVLSLSEMDELLAVQEATGTPVLTVFQHRFGPAAQRLRRLAGAGDLGRPLVAVCETLWYRDEEYFAVPWRGTWEAEGGGPTMGHGIHQYDLLLSVLGPWSRLTAFAGRLSRPTDTEDVAMAVAEFANGAMATVVNSVVSPREISRLRFDFEHATAEVEHLYGYRDEDWTFTPAPGHEHLADRWHGDGPSDEVSGHRLQIAAVLDALASGSEPEVGLADARRTIEFAAAVYASAFGGRPVAAGAITENDPFAQAMGGGVAPWAPSKETVA